MKKRSRLRALALAGGLPEDAVADCARVTMTGRSAVLVEGQRGVIELAGGLIRLKTGSGVLAVSGQGLRLRELSLDEALIDGEEISGISYMR